MVSPRPSWSSSGGGLIGSMPRPQMAASKLTLVRVDGLSKMRPTRPPASVSRAMPLIVLRCSRQFQDQDPVSAEGIQSQKVARHDGLSA